jgi:hypothetical protein
MAYKLPDFETLVALAKSDPHALEKIRQEASHTVINDAPESLKRRLRGLQFQIDMEIRRSKSHLQSCIRVSGMMHDSLAEMRQSFQGLLDKDSATLDEKKPVTTAKIIPFEDAITN